MKLGRWITNKQLKGNDIISSISILEEKKNQIDKHVRYI